jgi:hypothetical protein
MADRDWDKELAKVDKQLASMSDDALLGTAVPTAPAAAGSAAREAGRVPARSAPVSNAPAAPKATSAFGVYARLTLVLVVGAAMALWPYPSQCGAGLLGYLAAVGVVTAGGLWSSIWTWKHRAPRAHTLSLLVVLWGLVLAGMQVLPRTGYAKPDLAHPATWLCR